MDYKLNNEKAVIYARYSSDSQTEQSIEGQIRVITEYAKSHNIPIIDTYIDRAISGRREDRPEFQKMIKDSKKQLFGYVLVYKYDRFSRDRLNSLLYKRELKKNGVKVISVTEYISDDPQGILFESIIDGYSEYYSAELAQKVKRGNRESRLKGLYTGGNVIYGYKIVDKKYTIVPEEAEVVKQIFQDLINGETYPDVCERLTEKGIMRHGGVPFRPACLHKMVHNKKYIGIVEVDGEVFDKIVPPIIDKETFDKLGKAVVYKKEKASHYRSKDRFLLSSKLFCGYCGKFVTSESGTGCTGKVMHYYKCSTKKFEHNKCELKNYRKDDLEELVVKGIKSAILQSDMLEAIADGICKAYNETIPEDNLLKLNEKALVKNQKEIDNAVSAILSGITNETIKKKLTELEEEKKRLEEENIKLKIKSSSRITPKQALNFFQAMMNLDNSSTTYKKTIIDRFVRKVILYNDRIVIDMNALDGGPGNGNESVVELDNSSNTNSHRPPF